MPLGIRFSALPTAATVAPHDGGVQRDHAGQPRGCVRPRRRPGTGDFVASNAWSLAQAYAERDIAWPRAIVADGTVVGFIMLQFDPDDDDGRPFQLWRLMIDADHQGKGYGRAALSLGVEECRRRGATELTTSWGARRRRAGWLLPSSRVRAHRRMGRRRAGCSTRAVTRWAGVHRRVPDEFDAHGRYVRCVTATTRAVSPASGTTRRAQSGTHETDSESADYPPRGEKDARPDDGRSRGRVVSRALGIRIPGSGRSPCGFG